MSAPTIRCIQEAVAAYFEVDVSVMTSQRLGRREVLIRRMGMYVAHKLTANSYAQIGRAFGGRDHTAAKHAVEVIAALKDRPGTFGKHVAGCIEAAQLRHEHKAEEVLPRVISNVILTLETDLMNIAARDPGAVLRALANLLEVQHG